MGSQSLGPRDKGNELVWAIARYLGSHERVPAYATIEKLVDGETHLSTVQDVRSCNVVPERASSRTWDRHSTGEAFKVVVLVLHGERCQLEACVRSTEFRVPENNARDAPFVVLMFERQQSASYSTCVST
eukprot:1617374-Amphidinium_carterae.1